MALLRRGARTLTGELRERLKAVKQNIEGRLSALEADRDQAAAVIQELQARVTQLEADRDLAATAITNLRARVKVLEGFHGIGGS